MCHGTVLLWFLLTGKSEQIIIILGALEIFGICQRIYLTIFGVKCFTKIFSHQNFVW